MAGSLLDKVSEDVDTEIVLQLKTKHCSVTILQDGWSNIKHDPIAGTSIHTGGKSFMLDTVDCAANKKTADYCADLAKKSIELVKGKFRIKLFAVRSDKKNKIKTIRQLIKEDVHGIITYGYSAYYISLLEIQLTPKIVLAHVVKVQKFFSHPSSISRLVERIKSSYATNSEFNTVKLRLCQSICRELYYIH